MTADRTARLAAIRERHAKAKADGWHGRYVADWVAVGLLLDELDTRNAELAASEARVREARKVGLMEAVERIEASVSMARTITLTGPAAQHWAASMLRNLAQEGETK